MWWFRGRSSDAASTDAAATVARVVDVSTGTFTDTVSAPTAPSPRGRPTSSRFGSAGTVTAVNVAVGDTVTAGQVLASIDSAALEAALRRRQATAADAAATLADDQDADASDEQIAADESRVDRRLRRRRRRLHRLDGADAREHDRRHRRLRRPRGRRPARQRRDRRHDADRLRQRVRRLAADVGSGASSRAAADPAAPVARRPPRSSSCSTGRYVGRPVVDSTEIGIDRGRPAGRPQRVVEQQHDVDRGRSPAAGRSRAVGPSAGGGAFPRHRADEHRDR